MVGFIIFITIIIVSVIALVGFQISKKSANKSVIQPLEEYYDLKEVNIEKIDRMEDGSEFEMYLYRLFLHLGYQGVYKTVGARDFGADVVFTDREGIGMWYKRSDTLTQLV
ncbi:restriction endonuclease [Paenibacillus sp. 2TAB19]|uniref:restriction endonuclease n=1 Tax=Paenibacillus sp. 2TAB19 TaxID=3233003 RepID=UPI003F953324